MLAKLNQSINQSMTRKTMLKWRRLVRRCRRNMRFLIIFSYILLISNSRFSRAIWKNIHSWVFQRLQIASSFGLVPASTQRYYDVRKMLWESQVGPNLLTMFIPHCVNKRLKRSGKKRCSNVEFWRVRKKFTQRVQNVISYVLTTFDFYVW